MLLVQTHRQVGLRSRLGCCNKNFKLGERRLLIIKCMPLGIFNDGWYLGKGAVETKYSFFFVLPKYDELQIKLSNLPCFGAVFAQILT